MTNEEAIKHVENMKKGIFLFHPDELYDTIINALKKEPKTGRWVESEMSIANIDGIKVMRHTCSECKYYFAYKVKFNYCPNCGAKMT